MSKCLMPYKLVRRAYEYSFSSHILQYGPVAQRLEQGTHNPLVVGSNPTGPTIYKVSKLL